MAIETKTVLLQVCDCGFRMEIRLGQSGSRVSCPSCGHSNQIDDLSSLDHTQLIEKKISSRPGFQLSLRNLILLVIPFAFLSLIIENHGFEVPLFVCGLITAYALLVFSIAFSIHKIGSLKGWFADTFLGVARSANQDQVDQ